MEEKEAMKEETVGQEVINCLARTIEYSESLLEEVEKRIFPICSNDREEIKHPAEETEVDIPEYFSNIRQQTNKIINMNSRVESLLSAIEL